MVQVLAAMITGIGAGIVLRRRPDGFGKTLRVAEVLSAWVVRLLLFMLGWGIGRDSELMASIPEVGLRALVLAAATVVGSVVVSGLMAGGRVFGAAEPVEAAAPEGIAAPVGAAAPEEAAAPVGATAHEEAAALEAQGRTALSAGGNLKGGGIRAALRGSAAAVAALGLGVLCGLVLPELFGGYDPAPAVLYLLMFLVGVSAGSDASLVQILRGQGWRMMLLPLGVILGTAAGCLGAAVIWRELPLREALAVGAGFGYYSLSSLILRELSGEYWASVALLSNLFREILTLITAPLLVRLAGPAAPAAAGGATSMDTTLGVIVQSSGKNWAVPALFSGVTLTILTPVAVSLVMKL